MSDRAMKALKTHGLTIDNILKTPVSKIRDLIRCVSFYTRKADYLIKICKTLKDKYDYDIPSTFDGLKSLPGVGPKMAHVLMQFAWGKTQGIGVDGHVHRVSNRIGWVHNTKTPEHTRQGLEEWVPLEEWGNIGKLLIGFGQTICLPKGPKCEGCLIKDMCPSAAAFLAEKKQKKEGPKKKATRKKKQELEEDSDLQSDEDEIQAKKPRKSV